MYLQRFLLVGSAIATTIAFVFSADFSLPESTPSAKFFIENQDTYNSSNTLEFNRVKYVGQCPGTAFEPPSIKAYFMSNSTPPAPGRRVIIRNVTKQVYHDSFPYTDREYDHGQSSEGFDFKLNFRQHDQTFSVVSGENNFDYEIWDNKSVIEKGSLTLYVNIRDTGTFGRSTVCQDQQECTTDTYYDDWDTNHRHPRHHQHCQPVTKCSCP